MKIGIIQASSQVSKNDILYSLTMQKTNHEVINFGCFKDEKIIYSYNEISILIGLLLSSKAVDFIITGCSSGQGMMLACNNMPGVICGYTPTPQDAFLFGRINNGNAISIPLGLNFGWAGEINLGYIIEALFEQPLGIGYPKENAKRKIEDTNVLKEINTKSKVNIVELLDSLDDQLITKIMTKQNVINYIIENGKDSIVDNWIKKNM
ncbi:MAG: RpiB/LacA/LacB family sugar-phosphate isomerase [Thomasclavelia sp.]|nr:RpiB/LacA/LacB family sugar-phosphate isomerase [Thomasclavelia sp.]